MKNPNFDELVKSQKFVIPAEAGIQNYLKLLDSGFHRNDIKEQNITFYETINFYFLIFTFTLQTCKQ